MVGLLPAGMRCSAYWYALHRGLPTDLGYLRALGLTAYRMARWEGLEEWKVPEGPFLVYQWPERIWDAAAQNPAMAGSWYRESGCERCNYDTHRCPGCGEPLPHGTEICAGCDDAWGGRGPSASYREWRDEGVPWGGDDIRVY